MVDEYVVFCAPTTLQRRVYKALLESQGLLNCLYHGDINAHLKAITIMRKICNSITLIKSKVQCVSTHSPSLLTVGYGRPSLFRRQRYSSVGGDPIDSGFRETFRPAESTGGITQNYGRKSRSGLQFHKDT